MAGSAAANWITTWMQAHGASEEGASLAGAVGGGAIGGAVGGGIVTAAYAVGIASGPIGWGMIATGLGIGAVFGLGGWLWHHFRGSPATDVYKERAIKDRQLILQKQAEEAFAKHMQEEHEKKMRSEQRFRKRMVDNWVQDHIRPRWDEDMAAKLEKDFGLRP